MNKQFKHWLTTQTYDSIHAKDAFCWKWSGDKSEYDYDWNWSWMEIIHEYNFFGFRDEYKI